MDQPQYLIDANAVIDYLGKKLPVTGMSFMSQVIDLVPYVSVIVKIEVLGFNAPEEHYKLLSDFMEDAVVIDLTDDIVNKSIDIRQKHKIRLPDAIIAATALVHDQELITRNTADFRDIVGLKTVNPWDK